MNRRTILYVMNAATPDAQIREAAEAAAIRQTHLRCLVLGTAPILPMYDYGVLPYAYGGLNTPENWTEIFADARQTLDDRVQAVETLLSKSDASGDIESAMCATIDVKHHVARAARVSDEAFFAPSLRATPEVLREAAAGVLFHSPIGFRLNGSTTQTPQRIFVAWDGSEGASSAVHAALPHLMDAKEVLIACIDPVMSEDGAGQDPGTDVAAWLSHHGCKIAVSQFPSGGRGIGQCIQDRAGEFGADLVVMGAYGHARMIQTVFGGTTRSMIKQTDLQVLLAH